uniref:Uncharacterized protein n=1 Tax=Magnetococcus massalia (strain MO-1) TaxID=451514 RepID=A0A1S7LDU4_MAGMO|nr:protein of unknown function [Candidatus Magnetococcus massalia]
MESGGKKVEADRFFLSKSSDAFQLVITRQPATTFRPPFMKYPGSRSHFLREKTSRKV